MHQTAIVSEGFRSLREGEAVEFFVETSDDGRQKAVNVTGEELCKARRQGRMVCRRAAGQSQRQACVVAGGKGGQRLGVCQELGGSGATAPALSHRLHTVASCSDGGLTAAPTPAPLPPAGPNGAAPEGAPRRQYDDSYGGQGGFGGGGG